MSFSPVKEEVLIATLGTEPQVVTLALDALRHRGFRVSRVIVLHANPEMPPLRSALGALQAEERQYAAESPPVKFDFVAIRDGRYFPTDIRSAEDVALTLRLLYQTVARVKRKSCRVHLSLAGGRKVMTAMGMVVAQLLLDDRDHVWHLLSENRLHEARAMHATNPDEITLIPIPVLRWSLLPSTLHELLVWDDPYRAIQRQKELREQGQLRVVMHFWQMLTPAEREVVTGLVREGASNTALARSLKRSPKTIANHLQNIYAKYRECLGLPEGIPVRTRLVADLAPVIGELDE